VERDEIKLVYEHFSMFDQVKNLTFCALVTK